MAGLLGAGSLAACRHHAPEPSVPGVPDTTRGIVRVVGSEPLSHVILARAVQPTLAIAEGPQRELLRGLAGVEVMLSGTLTDEKDMTARPGGAPVFRVDSFEVRAVEGLAAHDGVLETSDGVMNLRLASGERLAVRYLPSSLRGLHGARVYLVGPLDRAPAAYGIIARDASKP
jgi:hypothetical protein